MKTVAFEIAESLAHPDSFSLNGSGPAWQAPDWYIQAVSGGIGPLGVQKGFEELYKMGLIDRVPKIGVVQVVGCSPMVRAFTAGKSTADPVVPETRITVLSTGAPGMGYELLYQANQRYGGHMLSVSDEEAFDTMRRMAKSEGYSVEPATAVAFAGLEKFISQGIIKSHETVVINCSGHTFPVEKHIMDEENVLDVQLAHTANIGVPVDGLGAALRRLDEQVTTIVVIDDNPMDSRLIRRLLQAKKPYRIFEANNAKEGLAIIKERLPDLVVSDLTMPEMDGFALLEELKKDPTVANIPVIVVSAKDLTPDDEARLAGQTSSIWMKGAFSTQDLVEHVVDTLSAPVENGQEIGHPRYGSETIELKFSRPEAVTAGSIGSKKVILIEDNPSDARLISRMLQIKYGLNVMQLRTGQDAVETILEERPHLIIMDLMVPDKNGFQILEELNQSEPLDSIPVIVITSKDLSETERSLLLTNGVRSMWYKDKLDRRKLIEHVEAQLG